jgi:hypothetical protein
MRGCPSRTALATLAWGFLLAAGVPVFVDVDVWHLMALARETLALGYVPVDDRFAYTPTVFPVVQHEWGSGMVLLFLARHGGLLALQSARVILATLLVVGAVRVGRQRGATTATLVALAPLAIVMSWIGLTAIRPQVFTLVLLALWLDLIEQDRRGGRRWVAVAIASQLVWQNLHAGFVVGWAFLALHTVEQIWRRRPVRHLLVLAPVLVALVAINPYGFEYYPYLARALTMDRPLIGEWQPIWHAAPAAIAVVGAATLVALLALLGAGPGSAPGWTILVAAIYLATSHERHVSIYALVWFAYVPALVAATEAGRTLQRTWERPAHLAARTVGVVITALCFALFASHRPWRLVVPGTTREGAPSPYPVGPVGYLDQHGFTGNVFVPFVVGAYVSWNLHPRVKVSIDSRYEVAYPPDRLLEHIRFYDAEPGWQDILTRYPTDLILVRHTDRVEEALATQTPWAVVYRDDAYTMFARPGFDRSLLPVEDRRGVPSLGHFP